LKKRFRLYFDLSAAAQSISQDRIAAMKGTPNAIFALIDAEIRSTESRDIFLSLW
jgi:hypothetical protein